jgi:hypothetical protein
VQKVHHDPARAAFIVTQASYAGSGAESRGAQSFKLDRGNVDSALASEQFHAMALQMRAFEPDSNGLLDEDDIVHAVESSSRTHRSARPHYLLIAYTVPASQLFHGMESMDELRETNPKADKLRLARERFRPVRRAGHDPARLKLLEDGRQTCRWWGSLQSLVRSLAQ